MKPRLPRLARNAVWSLMGAIAPIPAALIAIPRLIEETGVVRFGVLTIAWMVVGYFSMFDLGLGRALTKSVAERIDTPRANEIPSVVWTATALMAALGALGVLALVVSTPFLVPELLKIPEALQTETRIALLLLALSIPFVILTAGCRGLMEAHQHFGMATAIRIPVGILTYVAPLAVLPFSTSLIWIVFSLVIVRALSWGVHAVACWRRYPEFRRVHRYEASYAGPLLRFGGWLTVSSIVGPILLYLGRFVVAFVVSAEAVSYFVVPYEIVTQLLMIPAVAVGVLFPAFAQMGGQHHQEIRILYGRALIAVVACMGPLVVLAILLARPGIEFWIDGDFAQRSYRVAQILAVGVLFNSIGLVSQVMVQARGRPDWTAKLHLVELAFYVPYLLLLTREYGIEGAAAAWAIRVTLSSLALIYLGRRTI